MKEELERRAEVEDPEYLYKGWSSAFESFQYLANEQNLSVQELVYDGDFLPDENIYLRVGVIRQSKQNEPEVVRAFLFELRGVRGEKEYFVQKSDIEAEWRNGGFNTIEYSTEVKLGGRARFDLRRVAESANEILDEEKEKLRKKIEFEEGI